jgi:hypothetical protein
MQERERSLESGARRFHVRNHDAAAFREIDWEENVCKGHIDPPSFVVQPVSRGARNLANIRMSLFYMGLAVFAVTSQPAC